MKLISAGEIICILDAGVFIIKGETRISSRAGMHILEKLVSIYALSWKLSIENSSFV
jgi:hypothetical protein